MHAPPITPFLPQTNIQYAWDSTSLGYLKTCPRLYQYTMIDGWGDPTESVHLRFGHEYHSALELHDRLALKVDRDVAMRETVRHVLASTPDFAPDQETRAGKYKNRASLLRAVVDYLDHYEDDPATTYIKADGHPAVELSFRFELDWGPADAQPYLLCGHLDRVVTFNDELYVMDRKTTTTTVSGHYFDSFGPHNQMTLYTIAAQVILNSPIKGVIIDAAQVLMGETRFVRGFTYRTPDQLEEWLSDLSHWLAMAETYALAGYWPQNDTSCDRFGGCRFREVCSKAPSVRDKFLASRFTKLPEGERWNPLRSR